MKQYFMGVDFGTQQGKSVQVGRGVSPGCVTDAVCAVKMVILLLFIIEIVGFPVDN